MNAEERRAALAARRSRPAPATDAAALEARAEAHRLLRLERGADAGRYVRGAPSAVVRPRIEFATLDGWRRFLEPLYPRWAVEIGVGLYWPPAHRPGWTMVVLAPDEPPRRRCRDAGELLDIRFFQGAGLVDADGWWVGAVPGEPLGEVEPDPPARPASARDRMAVTHSRTQQRKGNRNEHA